MVSYEICFSFYLEMNLHRGTATDNYQEQLKALTEEGRVAKTLLLKQTTTACLVLHGIYSHTFTAIIV